MGISLKEIAWRAGIILMTAALGGCATSRAPSYYTLTPTAIAAPLEGSAVIATIGPFTLPEHLNRPQMVTRTAGAEIKLEEFHRWAEALEGVFVRTLASNVARQLGSDTVFEFPVRGKLDTPNRVQGNVQRFDVDEDGQAILEVQWTLSNRQGKLVGTGIRARYTATASARDDFAARADALSECVAQFAAAIAAALLPLH
jgi:uncharacterized lipoprotein YmbA